jgi:hypothetical protein
LWRRVQKRRIYETNLIYSIEVTTKLQKERFAKIYSKRERGDIVRTHNKEKIEEAKIRERREAESIKGETTENRKDV